MFYKGSMDILLTTKNVMTYTSFMYHTAIVSGEGFVNLPKNLLVKSSPSVLKISKLIILLQSNCVFPPGSVHFHVC